VYPNNGQSLEGVAEVVTDLVDAVVVLVVSVGAEAEFPPLQDVTASPKKPIRNRRLTQLPCSRTLSTLAGLVRVDQRPSRSLRSWPQGVVARFFPGGLFYSFNESYDKRPGRLAFLTSSELEHLKCLKSVR
jgi:hypothetical protein